MNKDGILGGIDQQLATDSQFGDSDLILKTVIEYHRFIAEILGDYFEHLRPFVIALNEAPKDVRERSLLDPVIRTTLREGMDTLISKKASIAEPLGQILEAAGKKIAAGRAPLEPESGLQTYFNTPGIIAWDLTNHGILSKNFRELALRNLSSSCLDIKIVLRSPTSNEGVVFDAGVRLLRKFLPRTVNSVLRHIYILAVVDMDPTTAPANFPRRTIPESESSYKIPGAIFLSPSALTSEIKAAEALLHEATHAKIYDLYLTRSIFCEGYNAVSASHIVIPWRVDDKGDQISWSIDRALGAFHVYVHLAVFFLSLIQNNWKPRGRVGARHYNLLGNAQTAITRARYLGQQVSYHAEGQLKDSGCNLVTWMLDLVEKAETAYPPVVTEREKQAQRINVV